MGKYLSIVLPTALISMLLLSIFCTFVGRKEKVHDSSGAFSSNAGGRA